jgi:DNA-binding FadR family transcriptional regulator
MRLVWPLPVTDAEAVQRLQESVDRMRKRPNDVEYLQAEVQSFWSILVRAAGNQVYVMAFNSLALCWLRYGAHLRHLLSDELRAINQYQAIVEACRKRDPERAAKHAGQLVQMAAEQIEKAASGYQQRQAVNNGDLFTLMKVVRPFAKDLRRGRSLVFGMEPDRDFR